MGVDVTTYLMYGIKLDPKKFDEELEKNNPDLSSESEVFDFLEDERDGSSNAEFRIVEDYICGNYIVVGEVLECLSEHEEGFYTISVDKLPDPDKLIEAINKKLNSNYQRSEFKLLLFNNFH